MSLKHYSKHNDQVLTRIDLDLSSRVQNSEFSEFKAGNTEAINKRCLEA